MKIAALTLAAVILGFLSLGGAMAYEDKGGIGDMIGAFCVLVAALACAFFAGTLA